MVFFSYFLCDWARKFARLSQPIRCKTKANDGLIARVFPRFKQFGCFYDKFSSALKEFPILLNGLSSYFGFGYMTLDRKAVYGGQSASIVDPSSNVTVQTSLLGT